MWAVHPTRREVHGRPCVPALEDLPEPVDAVAVAIPAPGVPAVVRAARARGCGAAVVFAAGFAEAGGRALQDELRAAAGDMPLLGPNCDGLVAFHARAALWGDALRPRPAGRVALISQSGNVAVNALSVDRGLRFHTVASVGNQALIAAADLLAALVEEPEVGSVALFLESDGDGAALATALARAAERGIGVAVLKVGATAAGATAAAAHTGAVAGDQRVFRALVEEAGGAWAEDVHDLLELAKALAVPGARIGRAGRRGAAGGGPERGAADGTGGAPGHAAAGGGPGLGVLTCSGGDSGVAADTAGRLGLRLPVLRPETQAALTALLPRAATVANPLDYTALVWGERERIAGLVRAVGSDPGIDQLLLFYDEPRDLEPSLREGWDAVRHGLADGAAGIGAAAIVASTLPELLPDSVAADFLARGVPAVAGLRTALACAAALQRPPGDPERLRAIAAAAAGGAADGTGPWLDEAAAKALVRAQGVPVTAGAVVTEPEARRRRGRRPPRSRRRQVERARPAAQVGGGRRRARRARPGRGARRLRTRRGRRRGARDRRGDGAGGRRGARGRAPRRRRARAGRRPRRRLDRAARRRGDRAPAREPGAGRGGAAEPARRRPPARRPRAAAGRPRRAGAARGAPPATCCSPSRSPCSSSTR